MPKPKSKAAVRLYFSTNRNVEKTNDSVRFGPAFNLEPNPLTCGVATATIIPHREEFSEASVAIAPKEYADDDYPRQVRKELLAGENLLLSIHGFEYRFYEAALRTAWLSHWFANANPAVRNTPLLFSWPSLGVKTPAAYAIDVQNVYRSGKAFDLFFESLIGIIAEHRSLHPRGRVVLLVHSLGALMLTVGLAEAVGSGPGQYNPTGQPKLFDAAVIAAGDTDYDALLKPSQLLRLSDIARRIVTYYDQHDLALMFAAGHHHVTRLGLGGPPDKPRYDRSLFEFVDCRQVAQDTDGRWSDEVRHHQYYRLFPEVRDDICGVFTGIAVADLPNRKYHAKSNFYRLHR